MVWCLSAKCKELLDLWHYIDSTTTTSSLLIITDIVKVVLMRNHILHYSYSIGWENGSQNLQVASYTGVSFNWRCKFNRLALDRGNTTSVGKLINHTLADQFRVSDCSRASHMFRERADALNFYLPVVTHVYAKESWSAHCKCVVSFTCY